MARKKNVPSQQLPAYGYLTSKVAKKLRYYTEGYTQQIRDDFPSLLQHYKIINVIGDGNCGPYSCIFASVNKGSMPID